MALLVAEPSAHWRVSRHTNSFDIRRVLRDAAQAGTAPRSIRILIPILLDAAVISCGLAPSRRRYQRSARAAEQAARRTYGVADRDWCQVPRRRAGDMLLGKPRLAIPLTARTRAAAPSPANAASTG